MNRVALITGGSRGIGYAIARAYRKTGMQVVITGRDQSTVSRAAQSLLAEAGQSKSGSSAAPAVTGLVADVTDDAAVESLVERTVKTYGRIDVLVNNAGRGGSGPTATSDPKLWYDIIDTNLHSVFRLTRTVLLKSGMVERKWGRIINIASIGGKIGIPFAAAYTASKHGVLGLTKALALELAKTGVTVNAICPGFVETDLAKDAMERHGKLMGVSAEDAWKQYATKIPIARWITTEEVAALAVYLASDESGPVLGQAFNVCGGIGSY